MVSVALDEVTYFTLFSLALVLALIPCWPHTYVFLDLTLGESLQVPQILNHRDLTLGFIILHVLLFSALKYFFRLKVSHSNERSSLLEFSVRV